MTRDAGILIREYQEPGESSAYQEFVLSGSSTKPIPTGNTHTLQTTLRTASISFYKSIRDVFLPVGFPHTVGPGYWEYQVFDSLQGLCSYLRGVVTSAQVLKATGVGSSEATAWSAALTWALKDGMGMMGGLVFSSWAAPKFDPFVKEFRFFADLINNVGLTLDMLAPILPSKSFLWVAAASTLCKTMCGMSAGATKGSITQHFAVAGNVADLHAKEGTQETLVSIIGMTCGVALARYFHRMEEDSEQDMETAFDAWKIQWIVFGILSCLHVWANYEAVQLLRLRTLNQQRTRTLLQPVVEDICKDVPDTEKIKAARSTLASIRGPSSLHESLMASVWHLLPQRWHTILLGVPLVKLIGESTDDVINAEDILDNFQQSGYVLAVSRKNKVLVSLLMDSNNQTELQAFLHAMVVERRLWSLKNSNDKLEMISVTFPCVKELFVADRDGKTIIDQLHDKGWSVKERLYLGYTLNRSVWSSDKND